MNLTDTSKDSLTDTSKESLTDTSKDSFADNQNNSKVYCIFALFLQFTLGFCLSSNCQKSNFSRSIGFNSYFKNFRDV